jgi:Putative Flp pilus-assembly TadE/G-like
MRNQIRSRHRPHERGQTMIFVAISIVSLLALAALAIDIVTLYVARTEIQRTADAAALAGAKAVADSGFTSLPAGDPNYSPAQTLAQTMATQAVNAMVTTSSINPIAGGLPLASVPSFDFTTHPGSYQVTVSLRRDNLPTFFSKIWARSAASVTATATAEAYNPANVPTFTPISPRSVKPWLVANADPVPGLALPPPFINTATGAIEAGAIGESFNLTADCQTAVIPCQLITIPVNHNPPTAVHSANPQVDYVPAQVTPTNPKNVCPPCAGATDYEQTIECSDANAYAVLSCGGGATNVTWDNSNIPGGPGGLSSTGAECLIHAGNSGAGQGQDLLDSSLWPGNPMKITAQSSGNLVTTSSSIVTIPIIDNNYAPGTFPLSGQPLTVVGFMQAFINWVQDGTGGTNPGDINVTVLNIAGCSATPNAANPVVGGAGTSPIPVRLITSP